MQAVLYVSHGSRVKEATDEAEGFLRKVHRKVDIPLYEISFLELARPTIEESVENLVRKGATHIAVVPVLLLSAGHFYKDIPKELEMVSQRFPHIEFTYGKPLGVQKRMTEVLVERITEKRTKVSGPILLVGRGSKSPQTKEDIETIANLLQKRLRNQVYTCYLAACQPSFDEELQALLKKKPSEVMVVPYLWFTGVLMNSMKERWQGNDHVVFAHYLHDHPLMIQALADRVFEVLKQKGEVVL